MNYLTRFRMWRLRKRLDRAHNLCKMLKYYLLVPSCCPTTPMALKSNLKRTNNRLFKELVRLASKTFEYADGRKPLEYNGRLKHYVVVSEKPISSFTFAVLAIDALKMHIRNLKVSNLNKIEQYEAVIAKQETIRLDLIELHNLLDKNK